MRFQSRFSVHTCSGLRMLSFATGAMLSFPALTLAQQTAPSLGSPEVAGQSFSVDSHAAEKAAENAPESRKSNAWLNVFQREKTQETVATTKAKSASDKKQEGGNLLSFMNRGENRKEEYTAEEQLDFLVAMARFREGEGDVDAAVSLYAEALKSSPDNLEVLLAYARLLDRQNRLDEAVAVYQAATDKHPECAKAYNDLGLCLARAGQLVESKKSLYEAIQYDPTNKRYRNNLATVLIELGQNDEALRELSAVHEPSIAHYNLGFLLQKRNRLAEARAQFAKASEVNPQLKEATRWVSHLDALAAQHQTEMAAQQRAGQRMAMAPARPMAPQAWPQAPLPNTPQAGLYNGAPIAQGWQDGMQTSQPQMPIGGQGQWADAPSPGVNPVAPIGTIRVGNRAVNPAPRR